MKIKQLFLKNFRSYEELSISFGPKVNLLFGENGRGKTNLLEALFLMMTGRSFRTRVSEELIRFGAPHAYLEILFEQDGVGQSLKMYLEAGGRRVLSHNETALTKLSALFSILRGTLLTPNDYQLIQGNPRVRRHFLDLQVAQTNLSYLHHLSRYNLAMKQRNHLLRQKREESIEIWEEQMEESGLYLQKSREEAKNALQSHLKEETLVKIDYIPSPTSKRIWSKNREKDRQCGSTTSGAHKDDLVILFGDKSAKLFASEGQKRHCALHLRIAQWHALAALSREPPLLLIDDIGLSFDQKREDRLIHSLGEFGQVFVTSAKPINLEQADRFEVCAGGKVQRLSLQEAS